MRNSCRIETKLPQSGISVFSRIAELAARHDAVNLWQGAPSFPADPALIAGAERAMRAGLNQYAPMAGYAPLKAILAEKTERLHGARYRPDSEITVTAGASEAIYAAIAALVHAGDEVIFFEPAFEVYEPSIRLQGATPVALGIRLDTLRIDWDEVAAAITPRTRMIIVNTPHNPTGALLDADDLARLAALTRDTDIVILSDEVYEHMVYDGREHLSVARDPELAERSVIALSLGKTYHATGWRVGYCLAPAELTTEIRKVHQYVVFSAPAPLQAALAEALAEPQSYLGLAAFYQRKRDLLVESMAGSRLAVMPSAGGFFMLARFDHFSELGDEAFAMAVLERHGVAAIPLASFYQDRRDTGILRLSFCKDDDTLREGGRRLAAI
ncbi:methionine aminotransferase [Burkholderia plantarii]|uniref:methionine aminotransferase n=1 Tax=Burkholderia plantarii TaxID=41899 RepID=UPI0006D8A5E0|nr:methionine aminotransferase [Burkholderia plantarii]ALK31831.1 Aspartate/tyrosine/aromatic aminotransferase [Burkholderia plantarii]GLZ21957.1 methionine aminotransferase [Burkholderia plantarii]